MVLVSDAIWRRVKILAARRDQKSSDVVEIALDEYTAAHGE